MTAFLKFKLVFATVMTMVGSGLILVHAQAQAKVVVIPMGGGAAPLQNVISVAKKNGDFTDPVAAIKSIEGLADENNRFLVIIGPGVYVLTETLVMQAYVDISGSGQNATKLIGTISDTNFDQNSALVQGADNAGIQSLHIENSGGSGVAIGVYNTSSSPMMSDITITASADNNALGVVNTSSSPKMSRMVVTGSGGNNSNYGVLNSSSSSPMMFGMIVAASGGSSAYGVYNQTSSVPTMSEITITTSGATDGSFGVFNNSASPRIFSTAIAVSSGNTGYGVYNSGSSAMMSDTTITVSGTSASYGVYNTGPSSSARIANSTISATGGSTNGSVRASTGSGAVETYISDSILTGSVTGDPVCSFSFDDAGIDLTADCIP